MKQLKLWVIQDGEINSRLIEIHYQDGRRRILDTSKPEDEKAFRDCSIIYAGFVEDKKEDKENAR